jgi:hypothetical protein
MIDFSHIGQDAFVIQYEDLISLIGLNTVRFLREKQNLPNTDDLTLEYLNRTDYDIPKFIQTHNCTSMVIPESSMWNSKIACRPNLAYAFKMMRAAADNGIHRFVIHSNAYSPVIEEFVNGLEIKTTYEHGDIVPVLRTLPNCTYTTSNPDNIRKCMDVQVPFALTIVDDFQYVAPIVMDQSFIDKLREKNVYVQFTGVISAGII